MQDFSGRGRKTLGKHKFVFISVVILLSISLFVLEEDYIGSVGTVRLRLGVARGRDAGGMCCSGNLYSGVGGRLMRGFREAVVLKYGMYTSVGVQGKDL